MDNNSTRQDFDARRTKALMVLPSDSLPVPTSARSVEPPALIRAAGAAAQFAWDEFVFGHLRNPHTRAAYGHAIQRRFAYGGTAGDRNVHVMTGRVH